MVVLGSQAGRAARRDLQVATARLDAALRGRDWSARALREAATRITSDAVIALYGRMLLHVDRIATPSGTLALCKEAIAGVDSARILAGSTDTRLVLPENAARGGGDRQLFLYVATPDGCHLEPCKADDYVKARIFASRVTSAVRTRDFELDPATRLRDLARRYELLEGSSSPVRIALAELRQLEARLRDENLLPRRYQPPLDPPSPPPLPA